MTDTSVAPAVVTAVPAPAVETAVATVPATTVAVAKPPSSSNRRLCEHGRRPSQCKQCGGSGICTHGRQKNQCKQCGGCGICTHGRIRSRCKACKRVGDAGMPHLVPCFPAVQLPYGVYVPLMDQNAGPHGAHPQMYAAAQAPNVIRCSRPGEPIPPGQPTLTTAPPAQGQHAIEAYSSVMASLKFCDSVSPNGAPGEPQDDPTKEKVGEDPTAAAEVVPHEGAAPVVVQAEVKPEHAESTPVPTPMPVPPDPVVVPLAE
eukprot:TRINITY_DN44225_c0_g1_i1.p1 TRINITY_DN44225_c0_g1~~TRINITY_DN44225_c0_g1_i1.p1  ORF type:complete len:260 (-),score=19.14 TRINITY_DN44225_c0_g1_i1:294-1073(-)